MEILKTIGGPLVLGYFRFLAKIQLRKNQPQIIGIAGSNGKTSLSYLMMRVVETTYTVKASIGKNSETGLPLHILGISVQDSSLLDWIRMSVLAIWKVCTNWEKFDVYIAEMGIDGPYEPKNMSYLLKIVQPAIGVVTNVNIEHSVYFDPLVAHVAEQERKEKLLDLIAHEETMLLTSLPHSGYAIINSDDKYISAIEDKVKSRKLSISISNKKSDFFVTHVLIEKQMFAMEFLYHGKDYILKLSEPRPLHFVYEALFAIGTGVSLGVPIERAIKAIEEHIILPGGRMTILEGIKHTTIIDSSYNANLIAMLDMLDFLKALAKKGHKVAILGDMRELGSLSRIEHEEVARQILRTCDTAILIGPLMENYVAPILKKKKFNYKSFLHVSDAKQCIFDTINDNDYILVKGSQNTLFLERVVEMLLANKKDVDKLCRRGEFWDKKRAGVL